MNLRLVVNWAIRPGKNALGFFSIALAIFLGGCAAISPLSISETTLEDYLREEVVKFDKEQLKNDSPLSIRLTNADITLGPDGREVVVLDIAGEAILNAIITKVPVGIKLKAEGTPVYKNEEKAIYIKRLKLLDSQIESDFFNGDFKPLTDSLMKVVTQMLEVMPVYRLDDSHWAGQLADIANMDVKVASGKLVFVPAD